MAKRATSKRAVGKAKAVTYAAPALDKGLDVLELLAHHPTGLSKSQVARDLNRTISEIFRMLVCLERRGYIAQVAEERYSLTLKMFRLVQEHPPGKRLILDALPVMHHLAQETLQSCHLGVLEGERVTILAQVNAPTNLGFYVKPGSTVDLMEAASGYVILAHQEQGTRERSIALWQRETGKKVPSDLEQHLLQIRKMGYEKKPSYVVKGVMNISFPILDELGSAIGALTVPYIQYNEQPRSLDQVIKALRNAAAEITKALGGSFVQPVAPASPERPSRVPNNRKAVRS